jgi:hypothetical protein
VDATWPDREGFNLACKVGIGFVCMNSILDLYVSSDCKWESLGADKEFIVKGKGKKTETSQLADEESPSHTLAKYTVWQDNIELMKRLREKKAPPPPPTPQQEPEPLAVEVEVEEEVEEEQIVEPSSESEESSLDDEDQDQDED